MKKLAVLSAFAAFVALTSCKKDRNEPIDTTPENMDQMVVPASFNWKTTKSYQLTVEAPTGGILEVQSSAGVAYQKAYILSNSPYVMQLTLPAYEKNIKLKLADKSTNLELNSNTLSFRFQ